MNYNAFIQLIIEKKNNLKSSKDDTNFISKLFDNGGEL
jgi:hypothetical protein